MNLPRLQRNNRPVPITAEQAARYKPAVRPLVSSYEGEALVTEDWLEVPIADGWVAAYRLRHSGRGRSSQTRILEVRVFPNEPKRAAAGEWSARFLGNRAKAPKPFSFEQLRRGVTEKSFDAALEATRANAEQRGALAAFGHPALKRHSGREGRGAGRPGLQRSFYALVAVRYEGIEQDPRREARTSTRRILQKRYHSTTSLAAIGKWLQTARKQGFLTKVDRGSRRSWATDLARQLAQRAR